jgi:hypothetical protein
VLHNPCQALSFRQVESKHLCHTGGFSLLYSNSRWITRSVRIEPIAIRWTTPRKERSGSGFLLPTTTRVRWSYEYSSTYPSTKRRYKQRPHSFNVVGCSAIASYHVISLSHHGSLGHLFVGGAWMSSLHVHERKAHTMFSEGYEGAS